MKVIINNKNNGTIKFCDVPPGCYFEHDSKYYLKTDLANKFDDKNTYFNDPSYLWKYAMCLQVDTGKDFSFDPDTLVHFSNAKLKVEENKCTIRRLGYGECFKYNNNCFIKPYFSAYISFVEEIICTDINTGECVLLNYNTIVEPIKADLIIND